MRRLMGVTLALLALAACDKKPEVPPATTSVAAGAVAPAQPGKDWLQVMAKTPEGGYRLGNPDAKIKLVEYASLTCPHCRDFADESDAPLRAKYVATGNVSYEYRNFLLNPFDVPPSLLTRCEGAAQFFNLVRALYAAQDQWVKGFQSLTDADRARLQGLAPDKQIAELGRIAGLDAFVRARGMTGARYVQCLGDAAALKELTGITEDATQKQGVNSTPTFFINGVKQDGINTWPQLEPKLLSALQ